MFHLANYSGVIQECFGVIDDGQRLIVAETVDVVVPVGPELIGLGSIADAELQTIVAVEHHLVEFGMIWLVRRLGHFDVYCLDSMRLSELPARSQVSCYSVLGSVRSALDAHSRSDS